MLIFHYDKKSYAFNLFFMIKSVKATRQIQFCYTKVITLNSKPDLTMYKKQKITSLETKL